MRTESSLEEFAREVITKQSSSTPIIKDAQTICEKLKIASNKWFELGLAFGLEYNMLQDIQDQYTSNKRRLKEMVVKRLEVTDPEHPMTWPYICECLRCRTVGHTDLAKEIEGKLPNDTLYIIIPYSAKCSRGLLFLYTKISPRTFFIICYNVQRLKAWLPVSSHSANSVQ